MAEVTVDIEVSDYLDEISDAMLIAEFEHRKLKMPASWEMLLEVRSLLMRRQSEAALALIERLMFPNKSADGDYWRATKNRDPETGRPSV